MNENQAVQRRPPPSPDHESMDAASRNRRGRTTRSFALAWLRWRREALLEPRLPERGLAGDGSGRLIAIKVEVQRNHARAAEVDGAKGGHARPRLVESQQ